MEYLQQISREMGLKKSQVEAVAGLLEDGGTIWFIARYRKEHTHGLDEVAISEIQERLAGLKKLDQRKEAILKSLEERGLLLPDLKASVEGAQNLTDLEDVYEAHRPKKQTRALKAREKGLGLLAEKIFAQKPFDLKQEAARAVNKEKGVETPDQALEGARDIIAETLCQDVEIRKVMRGLFESRSMISSKVKKSKAEEGAKFRDYFDWEEPAAKAPAHRIHALLRGQNEGVLTLHVLPEQETALKQMERMAVVHPSKTR